MLKNLLVLQPLAVRGERKRAQENPAADDVLRRHVGCRVLPPQWLAAAHHRRDDAAKPRRNSESGPQWLRQPSCAEKRSA